MHHLHPRSTSLLELSLSLSLSPKPHPNVCISSTSKIWKKKCYVYFYGNERCELLKTNYSCDSYQSIFLPIICNSAVKGAVHWWSMYKNFPKWVKRPYWYCTTWMRGFGHCCLLEATNPKGGQRLPTIRSLTVYYNLPRSCIFYFWHRHYSSVLIMHI